MATPAKTGRKETHPVTGYERLHGDARVWDDLRIPISATKLGGSKDPTFSQVLNDGAGSQGVFAYVFSASQEKELYFVAGMEGAIASIADNGGVVVGTVLVTDVGHGLTVGDYITQNGCADANYNGIFTILTTPTADTYTITATWGATDTGTWQMGSYLLCATAGNYGSVWNASLTQSDNAVRTNTVALYQNMTLQTKSVSPRTVSNNTDIGSMGGNGEMTLAVGDRAWYAVQSSDPQTLTFLVNNLLIQ